MNKTSSQGPDVNEAGPASNPMGPASATMGPAIAFEAAGQMESERLAASRAYWDMRAATFGGQCGKNSYIDRLIGLLNLEPGASVLDMGCATGTLALPLARAGHKVLACDFSPKMLERLREQASGEGLEIDTRLLAWQDDWPQHGVTENCVDVAVASRSMSSGDVGAWARKLDSCARFVAAATLSAGHIPAIDPRLMRALGRPVPKIQLVSRLVDELLEMGRYPSLHYIPCERPMRFRDHDMALLELRKLAGKKPFSQEEDALFARYASGHFREEEEGGAPVWQLDYTLIAPWTLVMWSTEGAM